MFLWALSAIMIMLMGLGGVAFLTLLERKLLSLSQIRLGPNKTSIFGLLQPVADGVKLLFKETLMITRKQIMIFTMSPSATLVFFLITWMIILPWNGTILMKYSSVLYFAMLGMMAYAIIMTGWSSTSSFSKLGSLRGMLQSLSFEVALILNFMIILLMWKSLCLKSTLELSCETLLFWGMIWFILSLMESNRAPFDLLEGESELISGFNLEMSSILFVLLFLSEYGTIIIMMTILSLAFFSYINITVMLMYGILLFMRSCFPRVRYDVLMSIMWVSILPVVILYFFMMMLLFSCYNSCSDITS